MRSSGDGWQLESDAPPDSHVGRVPSVLAIERFGRSSRCRQPIGLAASACSLAGRDGARCDALGRGCARYQARRPELLRPRDASGNGDGGDSLRGSRSGSARNESANHFPGMAARRSKPLARRIRLPRSIDLGSEAGRHDHTASGAFDDEQRPRAAPCEPHLAIAWCERPGTTPRDRSIAPIAWRSAVCPMRDERAQAVDVIGRAGLPAFARAIFNCNEFLYFD